MMERERGEKAKECMCARTRERQTLGAGRETDRPDRQTERQTERLRECTWTGSTFAGAEAIGS